MHSYSSPIFFGLLYVGEKQEKHANIKGAGDPLDIYLRCASLCAKSISYHGYTFRLITNDASRIERRIRQLALAQLDISQHQFGLIVPDNLPFRAAHFKLELYKLLGSGRFGEHVGVIDIDSVMIASITFPPLQPGCVLAYDISDQVMAEYGYERVRFDIERIIGAPVPKWRWLGGEFLFGHAESFQKLAVSTFRLWARYLECADYLHHVSDEMITAAAMCDTDLHIIDGGQLGFVARWWTARTNFKQMPFDAVRERSILHLPADKSFLAASACIPYSPADFIARFSRVARGKLFRRKLYNMVEMLLNRREKYVAQMSL
jgi:hypothetical protein